MQTSAAISTKTIGANFIPDISVLILYAFFLDPLMSWQLQNLSLSCYILMASNIAAVGLGCYTFFIGYSDMISFKMYRDSLSIFESSVLGLSAFISCLSFLWWLVPFAAVKKMGVQETYFYFGALFYFLTFMAVVFSSINNKKGIAIANFTSFKILTNIITIAFFFFSYAFLQMTLQHWQPDFIAAPYLALICLFVFYLPLRFFLLLRPPFSKLAYISFLLSFGFLMYKLFVAV